MKKYCTMVLYKFWMNTKTNQNLQWFPQDGGTTHTALMTLQWLTQESISRLSGYCGLPHLYRLESLRLLPVEFTKDKKIISI